MQIGIEDITEIVKSGKKLGHEIKVGDIAYISLLKQFKDKDIAYAVLFGKGFTKDDISKYEKSAKMKYLRKKIKDKFQKDEDNKAPKYEDITFGENKEALIAMIPQIEEKMAKNELDYKDGAKMLVDIRTRLNDKFSVSEDKAVQYVYVNQKFNSICPKLNIECWMQTKEFAMEHWGLIEDPNKQHTEEETEETINN